MTGEFRVGRRGEWRLAPTRLACPFGRVGMLPLYLFPAVDVPGPEPHLLRHGLDETVGIVGGEQGRRALFSK